MVFIHGGGNKQYFSSITTAISLIIFTGWMSGHGGNSLYAPDYLLEHDVILVTGNYRLGPLGFLSTENKECPGNSGLKDQSMMLTWVKMNIDKFGGNSNLVTIFGNSAGERLEESWKEKRVWVKENYLVFHNNFHSKNLGFSFQTIFSLCFSLNPTKS